MKAPEFEPFLVAADLCLPALEESVRRLGPSFTYDLYVHPVQLIWARGFLREMNAERGRDSPLAPYVNLHAADFKYNGGWCLCANGKCVGCVGW